MQTDPREMCQEMKWQWSLDWCSLLVDFSLILFCSFLFTQNKHVKYCYCISTVCTVCLPEADLTPALYSWCLTTKHLGFIFHFSMNRLEFNQEIWASVLNKWGKYYWWSFYHSHINTHSHHITKVMAIVHLIVVCVDCFLLLAMSFYFRELCM